MACYLIIGDDESLALTAIGELVKTLVGDGDRTLMVDDFNGEEFEMRSVVDAAQTAPFLTDRRVVLARGVGRRSVIYEEPRQVEQSRKPGHHEDDVPGLDPGHSTALLFRRRF